MPNTLRHLSIGAPPERVHQLAATREGIQRWWTGRPVTGYDEVGGQLSVYFRDPANPAATLEVLERRAGQIVWRFLEGPHDWVDTRITYALEARDDGGTTLLFIPEGWRQENELMSGSSTSWAACLMSLKSGADCRRFKAYPGGEISRSSGAGDPRSVPRAAAGTSRALTYAGSYLHNVPAAMSDDDAVFKALADQTRRVLLDRLRERNGQTLSELCEPLAMARQSATQHLGVLEASNLITTFRRGREKLHYLNPVPLWTIQERWIEKFERPRLRALSAVKRRAEEHTMVDRPAYVYVTYIASSPERVWEALTDPELTGQYWGHSNVSDWQVGSPWEHRRVDGSGVADVIGTVVESDPPYRLAMTFDPPGDPPPHGPSKVTFDVEPYHEIVRLTVTHENLADSDALATVSAGWPAVFANLKSLLETGDVLPRAPWEMHAEQRAAQMALNDPRATGP
jgi:uncharacterized protein YndB with AHSA1/START domain/DNA-binding transcriptional ArsR family regulator